METVTYSEVFSCFYTLVDSFFLFSIFKKGKRQNLREEEHRILEFTGIALRKTKSFYAALLLLRWKTRKSFSLYLLVLMRVSVLFVCVCRALVADSVSLHHARQAKQWVLCPCGGSGGKFQLRKRPPSFILFTSMPALFTEGNRTVKRFQPSGWLSKERAGSPSQASWHQRTAQALGSPEPSPMPQCQRPSHHN